MFKDNADFYPTSPLMQAQMIGKINKRPNRVLEPSAGAGDLIKAFQNEWDRHRSADLCAIESDSRLQAVLRDNETKVIDSDFLSFSGQDKFDLILMNPPFSNGDQHLLKAIDIMYSGQIICLLNAETIKNPCTSNRQLLLRKLEELGAEIEYHQDAFMTADTERKTSVEVALVNIQIDRDIEADLFADMDDADEVELDFSKKNEISAGASIEEMVAEYDDVVKVGIETVLNFYRNAHKVGGYFKLIDSNERNLYQGGSESLTTRVQEAVNTFLASVRREFWRKVLNLDAVRKRMTKKKNAEFEHALNQRSHMDFTANNIRTFILSLVDSYEDTLTAAVLEIFDRFSIDHSYDEGINTKNVHYVTGWKTNDAFKIGKKVIIPVRGGSWGTGPFRNWNGEGWDLDHSAAENLRDIDVVFNYFDGMSDYKSIAEALKEAFAQDQNKNIETTYFTVTAHKKGTLHITFKDEDILRRFNVAACRGRGWIPQDYGKKPYAQLSMEEKEVVDSFEGRKSYDARVGQPIFAQKSDQLMLEAA